MLAAHIRRRMTGLLLLQDADDLFFREPAALHESVSVDGGLYPNLDEFSGLRLSDVSARGTKSGLCVTEDFWLIVVTEGNEDETEILRYASSTAPVFEASSWHGACCSLRRVPSGYSRGAVSRR
ncbi:protein of unknown function [Magnetospirillum gryphiswaldense MSR-1 v2]|uniref:Uncharacterized protein n=1 Tax=Magnetospirillum gryphiswaldense (strain DSM 6361 / JCM 21280 / NBRC 15271 / MSR-1) TaxID=431944 RepID=V6F638_MAGGM|nr:protein of unknown function [Magnetospirillum gryphiswaldense MSR-1 v2]